MNHEINILLVEDNEGDIVLTKEALREAEILHSIQVIQDGDEVLPFLKKEGKYKNAPSPDLIFLDINLPRMSGTEIVEKIKNDRNLKATPVIMLTTSNSEQDIMKSYRNHANCYITKPMDIVQFIDVVHMIKNFWIGIVQLPKNN